MSLTRQRLMNKIGNLIRRAHWARVAKPTKSGVWFKRSAIGYIFKIRYQRLMDSLEERIKRGTGCQ